MKGYTVNQQFILRQPNFWDRVLAQECQIWDAIQAQGGILAVMSPFRRNLLQTGNWDDPWIKMPSDGQAFGPDPVHTTSIPLPANDGVDHLVLSFRVPMGYDGIITGITHFYTDPGFNIGSGDLTWRIQVNTHYPRNLGAMAMPFGSLSEPYMLFPGGVRIFSQQVVRYFVNHAATSGLAGGQIVCGLSGWIYPRQ